MTCIGECSNCGEGLTHCTECHVLKPVDQTTFGSGHGNCFSACIAMLTDIPLESIPNFCVIYSENRWYHELIKWLRPLGLAPWSISMPDGIPEFIFQQFPEIPWIATGRTPRGNHSCVYIGGHLYHDPNPCREGLQEVIDGTFFLSTQILLTGSR